MSKLIKDATLRGIADAIREKTETSDPIKVKDFASVIANMETGATEGMFCWEKSDADGNLIGYVVSDNASEFPEDGQWDDGYYYKLQEMGEKYAEGTASHTASVNYSLAVSGLGFTPKLIYASIGSGSDVYSQTTQCVVENANGTATVLVSHRSATYASVPTFAITENGFTVTGSTPPAQYTMYCYANLTYRVWG